MVHNEAEIEKGKESKYSFAVDRIVFTLFWSLLPVAPGALRGQVVGGENARLMLIIGPTPPHQPTPNLDGQAMSSFKMLLQQTFYTKRYFMSKKFIKHFLAATDSEADANIVRAQNCSKVQM